MARDTFESWIPEEKGSKAIVQFQQKSAVDALATHEPMAGDTKQVPRDGGFTVSAVAKGSAYGESTSTNDYVELIARKIGGVERVAEEDLNDSAVDILETKRIAAGTAMAKFFDNATIAVTAVGNGTTKPYNSLYYTLTQNDSFSGYTANANLIATAGVVTYDDFNNALALVEGDKFADDSQIGWLCDPSFKSYLRGLLDGDDRPMWIESMRDGGPGTILGYPVRWSRGLKTASTATQAPSGNALAVVGDMSKLIVGDAKLPGLSGAGIMGTQLQRAAQGVGFLTDEALMKAAMRKGFAVGVATSFAIIEKTAS